MTKDTITGYRIKMTIEVTAEIESDGTDTRSGKPFKYEDVAAYHEKEMSMITIGSVRRAIVQMAILDQPEKILGEGLNDFWTDFLSSGGSKNELRVPVVGEDAE